MSHSDPTPFDIETLVARLRSVARQPDAARRVRDLLDATMADPHGVAAGMPTFPEDDVILYEDDSISIWHSRFQPGVSVPPHDHQMSATIGVYQGSERNDFFENDPDGGIRRSSETILAPGDVLSIGPNAIHAVTCVSEIPCCGIHVYLGNLTEVERSLFDVQNDEKMAFIYDNYQRLFRPDE